jgi:7-cyano-7-deazaguanine reductase
MKHNLTILGKKVTKFTKLETFAAPPKCERVICTSDEVSALCPVTGQPDWYTVEVDYVPNKLCVESKSLKLYLQSFRNAGHFCEAFSNIIAKDLADVLDPVQINVTVTQKPRGGISIKASSVMCP